MGKGQDNKLPFHDVFLYCHLLIHAEIYIYIYWTHTDAMINRCNDKVAGINDAHRKTQKDFFIKYFTSHFICKVSKRVTQSLRERGSWRPNITEIFWPRSYGRQRCVFLVLHGCSTGARAFLTTSHLPSAANYTHLSPLARWTQLTGTQLSSVQFVGLILPSNSHAVIWTRLRNFFRYLATGMCHFRFLWNGLCDRHRAEITVIQFRGHSLPVRQYMRV